MIHGPCGILNPTNVCMSRNKQCRSHFPKDYTLETILGESSYPKYRCLNNGRKVKVRGHLLDNRWIVPYNPYLLAKFNCHINVEICSTIKAVKYLYKYVYKGHDKIAFSIHSEEAVVDEIKNFQTARWISPPEALWRIFDFILSKINPPVVTLQLHLENNNLVTYKSSDNLEKIVRTEFSKKTMLTEFFYMNLVDKKATTLLYKQFPEFFVWDSHSRCWSRRKQGICIGRIVAASPKEGERYYLRLLLNHVRGATSYQSLKIVNGVETSSFREAALLHGLLNGDANCDLCLQEASEYQMPNPFRRLFATILTLCAPNDPKSLWNKFKIFMIEDFIHTCMSIQTAEHKALLEIHTILEHSGKSINSYGFVSYNVNLQEDEHAVRVINDELSINVSEVDIMCAHQLNTEQKAAYNTILNKVDANVSGMFFIDGPGGTGKTFLYRALLGNVRSRQMIALATASSGVAAGLLPGGQTAHSKFKIPLEICSDTICNISKQSALAELFQLTKLIIWDEAPMVNRYAVEALDKMLRDVNNNEFPFGGKVVVLGGDFRQILPVVQRGSKDDVIAVSLVSSYLWPLFTKLRLSENMRARLDTSFSKYLLNIGDGIEKKHSCNMIQLPPNITIDFEEHITSLQTLIDIVYPNLNHYADNLHYIIDRVILTPRNEYVDEINTLLISQLPGECFTYFSFDETIDTSDQSMQEDFLNTLTPNGVPPHELILKPNCPVILLRNINPS